VRVPAVQAVPKPKNTTWEEAASFGLILQTVWRQLVKRGRLTAGDHVLIWGAAGGLGSMAIQVARLFGAHPIAVASSDDKLAYCKELGAEHLLNRSSVNVPQEVRKIAPAGPDIVFEHPGKATIGDSLRMVKWGGSVVSSGATTGYDAEIDLRHIFFRQVSLIGSTMGSRADLVEGLKHVESGRLRPTVTQVMSMKELGRAETMMENDEVMGKVVLTP
jgi:NADPH:quinone reductase-like Zn-dependent oxidoreductase